MNPQDQQPQQNEQPQTPPEFPQQPPELAPTPPKKSHKKLALVFLLGPTALLLFSLLLYALSNLLASSSQPAPASGELFGEANPIVTVVNVFLFTFGTIGVLTWLPGIIVGAILLIKK